jgi:CelD/BcsL family acetyltransferase involved in cellulose biosynthesis
MTRSPSQQAPRVEIVETGERLAELAAPWTRLWHDAGALVFQSHAWVSAWWNTLPSGHPFGLRIGLLWQGEELRAALPLVIRRRGLLRMLEWAAISCTDYPDVLATTDCPPERLASLWEAVVGAGGFDIAQLARLLPDARSRAMLAPGSTGPLQFRPGHRSEMSYRVVSGGTAPGGWLAQQSKKTRQNYRRGWKALEDGASARFRLLDVETEPLAPIVARFNTLKRKWLVEVNKQSELLEVETGAIDALVEVLKNLGILRVFVIERNDEIVALSINFEQRGTMMALLTTYDPAIERASPGSVLIVDYIQWSSENGLKLVDFLCGAEQFKLRFADQGVTLETLVAPRTLAGHAALAANRARVAWKQRAEARTSDPADGGVAAAPSLWQRLVGARRLPEASTDFATPRDTPTVPQP